MMKLDLFSRTNVANCSTQDRMTTEAKLKTITDKHPDRKCKVYLIHGDLTLGQMNSLYANPKVKAYVTHTHGEGFGMPIFEAAYHGIPVLAPAWSGQNDFLFAPVKSGKQKKEKIRPLFCKVDYEMVQVPPDAVWDGVIQADSLWCNVTEKSAKSTMRDIYKNYPKYLSMAKKLKKHLIKNFTEQQKYKEFADHVYKEEVFEVEEWLQQLEAQEHE